MLPIQQNRTAHAEPIHPKPKVGDFFVKEVQGSRPLVLPAQASCFQDLTQIAFQPKIFEDFSGKFVSL